MKLNQDHLFYTSGIDIEAIISPLKEINITYFAYVRSYLNQSRVCLTNRTHDLQAYLENRHYLRGNVEANPTMYQPGAVLWSTLPNQYLYQFSRENFDIDHGVTLINPKDDYCEFFAFASTSEHPEVVNFYLNHLDALQRFTLYFKDKASCLISDAEKHKIIYPHQQHSMPIYNHKLVSATDTAMPANATLSSQQLECAKLLMRGKKFKEIADSMNLSVRTVEYYVDILKFKLHCRNKTELILKLAALLTE